MPNPVTSGVQPITGPQRSGFDKSHKNLLTGKVGTLIPVLCDPVVPGTRVNLKDAMRLAMPPLASDTFMDVKLKKEAFFVPASACYGGFNDFITKRDIMNMDGTSKKAILPYIDMEFLNGQASTRFPGAGYSYVDEFTPGLLADYLGMKAITQYPSDMDLLPKINPLPFLAYHRIYDRFYRNSLVTKPIFSKATSKHDLPWTNYNLGEFVPLQGYSISQLPYLTFIEGEETQARIQGTPDGQDQTGNWTAFSGVSDAFDPLDMNRNSDYAAGRVADNLPGLFGLHQRNFGADYFTTATPTPQRGDPSVIEFTVDGSGDGEISIAAIRAMNAMQLFRERNNYIDDNIHSYNRAHYNVNKTGYGESLPVFLGQDVTDVYTDGVNQTSEYSTGSTQNPFGSVGAQYGQANAASQGQLIDSFEAPEFGYIMVIASLVPNAVYSSGIDRHMLELVNGNGVADIPDALLQNVGPQDVYQFELYPNAIAAVSPSSPDAWKANFGYQQRFAHYMEKRNAIHGLFRDGQSLEAFSLQRSFSGATTLTTSFLRIPCNFLDQVAAVAGNISNYGYWMDIFFDYKVSMPLAAFSIPSLENPDGPTEFVPKPGYTIR